MDRKVIGEGSYGCVHDPSITCKTKPSPDFDYSKYVSKLMKNKYAMEELNEFTIIGNIDTNNEFHLGKPIICTPDVSDPNVKKDIQKCKKIGKDIDSNQNDYRLLIQPYGGRDIDDICNSPGDLEKYFSTNTRVKVDMFFLKMHTLFKGIKVFRTHNILHNDIKPQNILFRAQFKFIDFGLMQNKDDIIRQCNNNSYDFSVFHWSMPFDCAFMNKTFYNKYKKMTAMDKELLRNSLSKMIIYGSNANPYNLKIRSPKSFNLVYKYISHSNTIPPVSSRYSYITSFFDGFNTFIENNSYEFVLNKIIDSIDIYGLGFSLKYLLNMLFYLKIVSLDEFLKVSSLFFKMYDFNPITRVTDIDILINEYESILLELGILSRLKKTFENNNIVDEMPIPKTIMNTNKPINKLSNYIKQQAYDDPVPVNNCPNEKPVVNPKSGKCVKTKKKKFVKKEKN